MATVTTTELVDALWALADGPGTTIDSVLSQPALMRLRYIVAEAQPGPGVQPTAPQVASLVIEHIESAARATGPPAEQLMPSDPDLASAALAILGVGPGHGSLLPHQRRKITANHMNMQVDTLRHTRPDKESHERRLVRGVAEEMYRRESDFALRTAREAMTERQPVGEALAANWLTRYEQYYRIWTSLSGLMGNLEAAIRGAHNHDDALLTEYGQNALYDFACFTYELKRFTDDFGGLWIFADANIEQAISHAVYIVEQSTPTTHRQDSQLRLRVRRGTELHDFLTDIEQTESGTALLDACLDWIRACGCDLASPDYRRCKAHRCSLACHTYIDLIDADWYKLADWYREPPEYSSLVEPDTLYKRLNLIDSGI